MVLISTAIIIIFALAIALAFAFGFLNMARRERFSPDYYIMFLLGLCWFILGIIFSFYFVAILGLILTVIGVFKRREWDKEMRSLKINSWKEVVILAVILICVSILLVSIIYQYPIS